MREIPTNPTEFGKVVLEKKRGPLYWNRKNTYKVL
jgi:hypothetical protein